MEKPTVTVMLTCYNRIKYTVSCVRSLAEGNPKISFRFVITDDNSNDGTKEALQALPYDLTLLSGTGQLFWNGGMEKALDYALHTAEKTDYYMLVNDDVEFAAGAVEGLIDRLKRSPQESRNRAAARSNAGMQSDTEVRSNAGTQSDTEARSNAGTQSGTETHGGIGKTAVIAGATSDCNGRTSYGGVRLLSKHFAKFALVEPSAEYRECDTFNGNCVLLPKETFFAVGNVDPVYRHSMSDYDYGMHIRRLGFPIYNGEGYVGVCEDNAVQGSWRDTSLPRKERLKKKESPKGLPKKDWYYFIRKNYGFLPAVYHSATPYLRILLKR